MKVNIYDDNLLIVFLMKEKYPIKDNISTIIKRILASLKVQYGISLNGYYNIDIYIDKYYGMVIEIMNQNDFLPIYTDEIEINVNLNKKNYFLYEIDDILLIPRDLIKNSII